MKAFRSGILGIMAALLSAVFVFSILSLAVVEGMVSLPPTSTSRPTLAPPNLTPIFRTTHPAFLRLTPTLPQMPTQCPPPPGWRIYFVQAGDSLADLAASYGTSLEILMKNNCLISSQLLPDTIIYLPPFATTIPGFTLSPTSISPMACNRPPGWIDYRVKSGDTLSKISLLYRIALSRLMEANCLTSGFIITGSIIWVPNVATSTPEVSPSPTQTLVQPTQKPTDTFLPPTMTLTLTPSITPTIMPTLTPTIMPTNPVISPTQPETDIPSGSPTPSETITPSPDETTEVPTTASPNPGQIKKTDET